MEPAYIYIVTHRAILQDNIILRRRSYTELNAKLMHGYVDQKHAVQKTVQPRAQRRVRHENTYASGRSVRARYYIPREGKTTFLFFYLFGILIGCCTVATRCRVGTHFA